MIGLWDAIQLICLCTQRFYFLYTKRFSTNLLEFLENFTIVYPLHFIHFQAITHIESDGSITALKVAQRKRLIFGGGEDKIYCCKVGDARFEHTLLKVVRF